MVIPKITEAPTPVTFTNKINDMIDNVNTYDDRIEECESKVETMEEKIEGMIVAILKEE